MRHSSSMMDQKLAAQNLEHSAMVLTQQKKLAAMEAQYERALSEVSEKHTATVQQLTEQVDVLERQRAEDRKCIAEMSASLHDTERNRADTVDRLKQMEEMVEQATARTEGALHDSNTLRKAVAKCSEEKQSYWQQTQELTELLKAAKSVILSQWQTDDKVERCTCGKVRCSQGHRWCQFNGERVFLGVYSVLCHLPPIHQHRSTTHSALRWCLSNPARLL
eukprot:m.519440 g.519440  ORF g.519440 m.519440 type:complete len:221 (+) comp21945_c0_seq8:377-1039(+)